MVVDAEKHGAVFARVNDARITPIGRLLRKSRLVITSYSIHYTKLYEASVPNKVKHYDKRQQQEQS